MSTLKHNFPKSTQLTLPELDAGPERAPQRYARSTRPTPPTLETSVADPSRVIGIDYEVLYSKDYSLRSMPVQQFVHDERFSPHLVSAYCTDLAVCQAPEEVDWAAFAGQIWVSHNKAFDEVVHERAIELGLVPHWARPARWVCSSNLAVYHQYPRNLEGAAQQILGMELNKNVRKSMKGRHYRNLSEQEAALWRQYAIEDARACLGIWKRLYRHWPDSEQLLSEQTYRIGRRGIAVDRERIDTGIRSLQEAIWQAALLIPWAESELKTLSPKALAEACRIAGIEVPPSTAEDDPRCEVWENRYGDQYPWVAAMRTYRKATKALRVLETIRDRTDDNGIMQFAMKYCGAAATARWSGDSGLNMQNLPREEAFGVDIRKCFIARAGKVFVIADLRQIEPIVLAWLVGDQEFLAHVRAGRDVYEAHARATMGYVDPRPLKQVDKQMRLLAKARVLGLSYGASHDPFTQIAKQMAGLDIDSHEAKRIVQEFRTSNPRITGLWRKLDREFKMSRGRTYRMELPSGRTISYFDVSSFGWTASITRGDTPRRFWGSKLVENLIQATARDVFANCLVRIEQAGFNIVWHVHDEVIVEVDESDAEAAATEIVRLMSVTPEWTPGLPVSAEAVVSSHYMK